MKQLTVVFRFKTESAFKSFLAKFKKHFPGKEGASWSVTAMSVENEITRLELLEMAIDDEDLDRARTILQMGESDLERAATESRIH